MQLEVVSSVIILSPWNEIKSQIIVDQPENYFLTTGKPPNLPESCWFACNKKLIQTTGYIIQWWATLASRWDGLSQYICEKLFHFI